MPVTKIKRLFTKWYVKRGYTFRYDFTGIPVIFDGVHTLPLGQPKAVFNCPVLVKPLLIFFSPSVYVGEAWGRELIEGFEKGIKEGLEDSNA